MGKPKRDVPPTNCWGAQLKGTDTSLCTRGHTKGNRHFKTKFCAQCKATMLVPEARVRCLSAQQSKVFVNNHSGGMWTLAAEKHGGFRFRVINNTSGCLLPQLIVFEHSSPAATAFENVPGHLQGEDGFLRLCVSRGTVVPLQHLRCMHYKPPSPLHGPPPPLQPPPSAPPPVMCEVLVPSVVMNLAPPQPKPEPESEPESEPEPEPELALALALEPELEPAPPQPETPSSSGESEELTFSSYRERRMHRNRLSAAKSRRTKREYIEALERQVDELLETVGVLRAQNWYLQTTPRVPSLEDALCPEWEQMGGHWCLEMN